MEYPEYFVLKERENVFLKSWKIIYNFGLYKTYFKDQNYSFQILSLNTNFKLENWRPTFYLTKEIRSIDFFKDVLGGHTLKVRQSQNTLIKQI